MMPMAAQGGAAMLTVVKTKPVQWFFSHQPQCLTCIPASALLRGIFSASAGKLMQQSRLGPALAASDQVQQARC